MLSRERLATIDNAVDSIVREISYRNGVFVKTDSIIFAVTKFTNIEIDFKYAPFSTLVSNFSSCGAIMCVTDETKKLCAHIILNKEKDLKFRRFSLVHELGHLATGNYYVEEHNNQYMICTHIQYDITIPTKDSYQNDPFIEAEDLANAFALKILLPANQFAKKMFEQKNISAVADCFGVTEDAVCSRSLLGQ